MSWLVLLVVLAGTLGCTGPREGEEGSTEAPVTTVLTTPPPATSPPAETPEGMPPISARLLWNFSSPEDMYGVGVAQGGQMVVAASWDWNIYALNATGGLLWRFETQGGARDVALSPSGSYIAGVSFLTPVGHLYLLNASGALLWEETFDSEIHGVDILEDGRVGVALDSGQVRVMDLQGDTIFTVETAESAWGVWDVAFDSRGNFALGADDRHLYLVEKGGKVSWKRDLGRRAYIYGVGISPDGNFVAAATQDRGIFFYDRSGRPLWRGITGDSNYGVAVSPWGNYVTLGSWDGTLYLLDRYGNPVWRYAVGDKVNRVAFSPDGDYLAAASGDGNVYLFALTRQ